MKITEKIVTSVTPPQQTNVLWHSPETGELKMFGNKGWEVVGGKPGDDSGDNDSLCSGTCGGYPINSTAAYIGRPYSDHCVIFPNTYNILSPDISAVTLFKNSSHWVYKQLLQSFTPTNKDFLTKELSTFIEMCDFELIIDSFIQLTCDFQKLMEDTSYFNVDELYTLGLNPQIYVKMRDPFSDNTIYVLCVYSITYGSVAPYLYAEEDFLHKLNTPIKRFSNNEIIPIPLTGYHKFENILFYEMMDMMTCGEAYVKEVVQEDGLLVYKCLTFCLFIEMLTSMMDNEMKVEISDFLLSSLNAGGTFEFHMKAIDTITGEIAFELDMRGNIVSNIHPAKIIHSTNEYVIQGVFNELEILDEVKWTNDNPPTFDGTTRHVISILDGIGCYTVTPIEETT